MTLGKIERFWKTIFTEFLSRVQFDSFEEAKMRLKLWIQYYNHKRPHQGIKGLCPADRFFEIQTELKKVMENEIRENVLETALRGRPQKPFYMVGRMGDQSVVIRAEKGKVKMLLDEEEKEEKELIYDVKNDDTEEDEREETIQRETEDGSGVGSVVGEKEAVGDLQGDGDPVGESEPMANVWDGSDVEGVGAENKEGGKERTSAFRDDGEAVAEDGEEGVSDGEIGEETGENPRDESGGEDGSEEVREDVSFVLDLLTKEDLPKVLEWAQMRLEGAGKEESHEEQGRQADPEESGTDPESKRRIDDGDGRSQGAGGEPEDVLPVAEQRLGGDARRPLRAEKWTTSRGERSREGATEENAREAGGSSPSAGEAVEAESRADRRG